VTVSELEPSPYLDWSSFWARDRRDAEWLFEPILARGRGHAIYAKHKTGKSLALLWMAAELAQRPDVVVLYFDYEMTEDDIYERLSEMGYGPESDLSRLRYALLPALQPLDTPHGAAELHALIEGAENDHPDAHLVVLIDTLGRAVAGEENSADTYRDFYRHTGSMLKKRGVTYARTDHSGKDPTKGQRGSSGKGDDVDLVWSVEPADRGGLTFKRDAARMSWVPEKVGLVRREDPLGYGIGLIPVPAGTGAVIETLERLGVSPNASVVESRKALKDAGEKAAQDTLRAAIRSRKERLL
jgi:hypothetical protein